MPARRVRTENYGIQWRSQPQTCETLFLAGDEIADATTFAFRAESAMAANTDAVTNSPQLLVGSHGDDVANDLVPRDARQGNRKCSVYDRVVS